MVLNKSEEPDERFDSLIKTLLDFNRIHSILRMVCLKYLFK